MTDIIEGMVYERAVLNTRRASKTLRVIRYEPYYLHRSYGGKVTEMHGGRVWYNPIHNDGSEGVTNTCCGSFFIETLVKGYSEVCVINIQNAPMVQKALEELEVK